MAEDSVAIAVPRIPIGRTGLDRWGGYVNDEWLKTLVGEKGRLVYQEMSENEPVIFASLFVISMLVRGVQWSTEPFDESAEAKADAEFLKECMGDMEDTWDDFIDETLSMLVYGWSYFEETYKFRQDPSSDDPMYQSKYSDGAIGWRAFSLRGQQTLDRWQFYPDGRLMGMWQRADVLGPAVFIPLEKAVLFRTSKRKGNPEGRSVLRGAYRPWHFKKNIEFIEGVGIERDLAGLPVMYVPPAMLLQTAPPEAAELVARLKKMMMAIKRDEREGLVMPSGEEYKFELMSAGGTRQFDTGAVIARKSQEIMLTMLTDFILLGHEQIGTQALSSSKVGVFGSAANAWLGAIAETLNNGPVKRLFKYNGKDVSRLPKVAPSGISTRDVMDKIDALGKLSAAGSMPSPLPAAILNDLLKQLDMPEMDQEQIDELKAQKDARQAAELKRLTGGPFQGA